MISMDKQSFQELLYLTVARMDEQSDDYIRFCDIVLTCLGIATPDGNLAADYAASPLWTGGDDGTPLRPSIVAELATKIPVQQWATLSDALVPLVPNLASVDQG